MDATKENAKVGFNLSAPAKMPLYAWVHVLFTLSSVIHHSSHIEAVAVVIARDWGRIENGRKILSSENWPPQSA